MVSPSSGAVCGAVELCCGAAARRRKLHLLRLSCYRHPDALPLPAAASYLPLPRSLLLPLSFLRLSQAAAVPLHVLPCRRSSSALVDE